jgi:Response regulator containing CheY-like receiver, AAA-type ATPase, and DNA-binding domains
MEWVALVPSACMKNRDICQLIAGYFYDYHTLPHDLNRLLITIGHACGMAYIRKTAFPQQNEAFNEYGIVGTSPAMNHILRSIAKLVRVDMPVLISGESGTGKELTALAIHKHSARSKGPFVAVNCAALPANLIQSELFGYEKWAFTGAYQRKIGLIERAAGGTIFLDEIGDLPLELQVNLLRFLQHNTIHRIGGYKQVPVDVRVISATHIDLEKAIRQGQFREDLYYRLNVLQLKIPALRDRGRDVELLAQFFFENFKKERVCNVRGFSRQALRVMKIYSWPGNVRELNNRVHRAMVMCEKRLITITDLGLEEYLRRPYPLSLRKAKEKAEKETLQYALWQRDNCVSETARALGVSHVTLYRLIRKYGIDTQSNPSLSTPYEVTVSSDRS